MKGNDSTEMDRLIRRHARLRGEAMPSTSGEGTPTESTTGAHLDADEMNAYAEGALPDISRSRYFAHLADCDSCRQLVTQLTLAATSAAEARDRAAVVQPVRTSSRGWLAAIFSPPVLRYAVPALAMFAVVIIAIVVTRTRTDNSYLAQKEEAGRTYSPSIAANSNASASPEQGTLDNHDATSNRPAVSANASANVAVEERQPAKPAVAPIINSGPKEADQPTASATDLAKPEATPAPAGQEYRVFGDVAKRAETEVAATQSRPAQPETTATADQQIRDRQSANKVSVNGKDDDTVARREVAASKTAGGTISTGVSSEDKRGAGRRESAPPPPSPASRTAAAAKKEPRDEERSRESSEEQTVAGRTFRRQGNAWVDTAYRSSLATTNVARGSEQYRALLADEPGLRSITQRLSGELFVVWKSRAYRFY